MSGSVNRSVAGDGVELAVIEAGDPSAPTVVLVHGYPDTKEVWAPVIERLATDFHVVAYDVRGAGGSSAPRGPAAYRIRRLAADFEAVCEAVAPGRRVHLVGHDWGGVQGWEFVTDAAVARRIASFTTIAGPALGHALRATRRPHWRAFGRARRSWYIVPMLTPGGPTLAWRLLFSPQRWRWILATRERLAVDEAFPAATIAQDGLHGANLYRANIPPRLLRSAMLGRTAIPVQVVVPSGDRFISESYYESAEQVAPGVRWRRVAGSHWAQRSRPELVARWVAEFAREHESGAPQPARAGWRRGGGTEQMRGRLALVTGAGSGIGRATAAALADQGARVLLVDLDDEALARARESIPGSRALQCDVSDVDEMQRLLDGVLDSDGVPDVVVNNAGIGIAGPFLDTGAAQWRRIVDVNLFGVVHGCRLFGRAMVERGQGGQIVNTASAAAFMPSTALPAYATTKAAVLMLSECVRAELAPYGIGVTAVCPGLIATNITRATEYVGRAPADQERLRERVSQLYARRNFTPEQVASEIVEAIGADRPIAIVTPEAKLMRAISRLSPRLMRRLAGLDAIPA